MEFKPECHRCHVEMKPGYVIDNPDMIDDGGTIWTGAFIHRAPISVSGCWKCPACGHSFIPRKSIPIPA